VGEQGKRFVRDKIIWFVGQMDQSKDLNSRILFDQMGNQMESQTRTTRKTIDFTAEQVRRMDHAREERKLTYNEFVGSAVDAYLSAQPSAISPESIDQIQQRLWSLDSASQKSAERLAAIETQLDGLHRVIEQSLELVMQIAEELMKTSAGPEAPAPAEETPASEQSAPQPPNTGWYRPSVPPTDEEWETWRNQYRSTPAEEVTPPKRSWWRKGKR
jgi:hypothetical protein